MGTEGGGEVEEWRREMRGKEGLKKREDEGRGGRRH